MEEGPLHVLVDGLMAVMARRGHLRYQRLQLSNADESQKDRPPLSDEVKETIQMWRDDPTAQPEEDIYSATDDGGGGGGETATNFVSHLYINNRWGLYDNSESRTEEWWIADPPVLEQDDAGYLCSRCRHIDFRVLFEQRGLSGSNSPDRTSIRFEQLHTVLEREKSCAFCGLLARQMRADNDMSKVSAEILELCEFELEMLDEGPETGLMLQVQYSLDVLGEPRSFVIHWVEFASDHATMIPFNGLAIFPDRIGFEACNAWLSVCERRHPQLNRVAKPPKLSHLRLIDVDENCVAVVELPCRYLCLSYVWGGVQQTSLNAKTRRILEGKNGLQSSSVSLSKTITDAIEAARRLGMRYLWVDALCIQQDDAQDLAANIANMDAVYGNAALTIVASTNSDPTQGLPGVSTVPRAKEANYAHVQGMLLAVAMHDYRAPLAELNASLWNTRAWTFQERYLSQRLLIFTGSEAMFVCPHAVFCEDTQPTLEPYFESRQVKAELTNAGGEQEIWFDVWTDPTQRAYPVKMFRAPNGQRTGLGSETLDPDTFNAGQGPRAPTYRYKQVSPRQGNGYEQFEGLTLWDVYRRCASEYSGRRMSSPKDAVAAFTGLSNRIVQGVNAAFWFNIPSFAFARGLLWCPAEPMTRRAATRDDGTLLFPSWTWAAWQGRCRYRGRGWHNALSPGPVTVVQWLAEADRGEFIQKNIDRLEPAALQAALDGTLNIAEALDPSSLYHLDYRQKGWRTGLEKERNQTVYVHDRYPGTFFDYPIPLPGEPLPSLVRKNDDALQFLALTAPARFQDMSQRSCVREPGRETHLEIGLGDEGASANERPCWQRIIYHQGYRAGYLFLNIPFAELDLQSRAYRLVAVSREQPSSIAPPPDPDTYFALGPVEFQLHVGIRGSPHTNAVPPPRAEAEPATTPVGENGDAHWDAGRFRDDVFPVCNVLLVRDAGRYTERIGVGKMHWHALQHAGAKEEVMLMR